MNEILFYEIKENSKVQPFSDFGVYYFINAEESGD